MSVQNLRNKFSQNNGAAPYVSPGLDYGRSVQTPNNGNSYNHTANFHQQNALGRFNTIQEEPDVADDKQPVATKNRSFLQNYVNNGCTPAKNVQQVRLNFYSITSFCHDKLSFYAFWKQNPFDWDFFFLRYKSQTFDLSSFKRTISFRIISFRCKIYLIVPA